ncbi:hypothetical protein LU631_10180 [Erwinia tracheiphila]|uniref:hypothetical protein n=1 Tax=Erwinia tracheiphila TaxID=65700 RepID=UPI00128D45B8|nr:hypothetical protein [Erwinia tracheiphila]UIA89509.1 hypothetical protein LU631_10180 [Erwinia tracheiphila]UIA97891.1 hypothetical protein LU633_08860 [Erwinia tracheiphila]
MENVLVVPRNSDVTGPCEAGLFIGVDSAVLCIFLIIAFLSGGAGAFQIPTLSLYLSAELQANPTAISFFYAVNAAIDIDVSFWLAVMSGCFSGRRHLLMFCYLMAILNSLAFAFSRHCLFLLTAGVFIAAVANAGIPQLFALAGEYCEKPIFNALMRTQLSLAWVLAHLWLLVLPPKRALSQCT